MSSFIFPRCPIQNTHIVSRVSEILRLCTGKKVLHLGCADMPYTVRRGEDLLHNRLAHVTGPEMLWGLDISEEGVRILREKGFDHIILGDVEEIGPELRRMNFDIVLAGEILEHVANVGLFLRGVGSIMTAKTELVVTTPNATSFKGFVHAMLRREKVHPDHNYYFSYRTLKQLMEKFDLECNEIYYYQEVPVRAIDRALSLATRVSPVWADGLVARATLHRVPAEEPVAEVAGQPAEAPQDAGGRMLSRSHETMMSDTGSPKEELDPTSIATSFKGYAGLPP